MKFGIVVCAIVVIAYHQTFGYSGPALLQGNCKPEDVPPKLLGDCIEVQCNKSSDGKISVTAAVCPPMFCKDSEVLESRPRDLTKTYPDCCPAHLKCA